jgi:hypothetical protein
MPGVHKKIEWVAGERLFFLLLVLVPPPLIFAVESVEKVHFGIRKILEALYEQNTKKQ